jgi:orotate phosphoribosyltransferase-like protein
MQNGIRKPIFEIGIIAYKSSIDIINEIPIKPLIKSL